MCSITNDDVLNKLVLNSDCKIFHQTVVVLYQPLITMHLANNIDMQSGLIGGLIIGFSSTALMFTHGKITGISGILGNMIIFRPNDEKRWCWSYVMGLVSAGGVLLR